ncbi:MAG: hypothetical protein GXC94_14390 [Comamonadaceae bacterium]|nr:hypothetical protein [Comamonadaceae bacterium]
MSFKSTWARWLDGRCSQWFYPGPTRLFTADEMARAGSQPWPRALDHFALFNVATLLAMTVATQGHERIVLTLVLGSLLTLAALAGARRLWQKPTRAALNLMGYALGLLLWTLIAAIVHWASKPVALTLLTGLCWAFVATVMAWWVLVVYRAEQIEARLRELAEQDEALRLSTRLAAAQIQPHFLFNTLASLQHWVDTRDERAAPLLRDFTAYLRATLPMFERELQPLADEVEMVRRYLAIMQARLGARLGFAIAMPDSLDARLPPGLLLTLVENAIAHGIEPQLRGGHIEVAARHDGQRLVLTVRDDGPGLAPGWAEGVGLSNTRRRLLQACPQATLTLQDAQPGCLATLTLPS